MARHYTLILRQPALRTHNGLHARLRIFVAIENRVVDTPLVLVGFRCIVYLLALGIPTRYRFGSITKSKCFCQVAYVQMPNVENVLLCRWMRRVSPHV